MPSTQDWGNGPDYCLPCAGGMDSGSGIFNGHVKFPWLSAANKLQLDRQAQINAELGTVLSPGHRYRCHLEPGAWGSTGTGIRAKLPLPSC